MANTYWYKQVGKPLYDNLLWSRPESRQARGKLLIVGGNLHSFAAPAQAYHEAEKASIGTARVLLPVAVKKIIGISLDHAEFAASTPSGSFSSQAYGELALHADWADGVLLAGDFGRNSETAVLLEQFIGKYKGQLTITEDAADYFKDTQEVLVQRKDTVIVCNMALLQKIIQKLLTGKVVTFGMSLVQLVDLLHETTQKSPASIIVKHLDQFVVAAGGRVSTTPAKDNTDMWRIKTAARAAVWQLQNPTKPFEALTTAVFENH